MTPTEKTPLQQQIDQLKETAKAAEGHPFLPAAARDAIGQAVNVIVSLAEEVQALRAAMPGKPLVFEGIGDTLPTIRG